VILGVSMQLPMCMTSYLTDNIFLASKSFYAFLQRLCPWEMPGISEIDEAQFLALVNWKFRNLFVFTPRYRTFIVLLTITNRFVESSWSNAIPNFTTEVSMQTLSL